jgi:toxin FitB
VIVLDTNVVSELMSPAPAPSIRDWVRRRRGVPMVVTAITVAEVRHGIERLPTGRRRDALEDAAGRVFSAFRDSILPFDSVAALQYPSVLLDRDRAGLPIGRLDAQIAAICRANDAPLATRNLKDFHQTGVGLIDPWNER